MAPTPPISAGWPIVMSGPSGTGKSTLLNKLFEKYPDSFKFSVSCTTRQPRAGETPGVSYHYISRDEFKAMIDRGEFIEHAEFSGNMYGTPFKSINPSPSDTEAGKPPKRVILDLELNGVKSMKNSGIPCFCIFIAPPSIEELRTRLENRKSETPESLAARIASAHAALDYANSTPSPYDAIIVNGSDVDAAAAELERVIFADAASGTPSTVTTVVAGEFTTYAQTEAAKTQLVTADGTNAFNIHCPSCKCLILKKGVAKKVDHQTAVELPLIPTQSPHTKHSLAPTYNWSVSDMMAFENIGFTKPVPGSTASSSTRYLSCADCDVGPVGFHPTPADASAPAGKVYLVAADRVRYKIV